MRVKRRAAALLSVASLVLGGCESPTDLPAPQGADIALGASSRALSRPQTLDELWAGLARGEIPGFAGHSVDANGQSIVYLATPRSAAAARAYVANVRRSRGEVPSDVRVVPVQYDFAQLKGWSNQLVRILDADAVFSLDVDETLNRIVLGARDAEAVGRARREVATRGIPAAAVEIRVTSPPVPRSTNLLDPFRPTVPGGVATINAVKGRCTIGFNASFTGNWWEPEPARRTFVTASHCSAQDFAYDGSVQYQPASRFAGYVIGQEYRDTPKAQCNWLNVCFWRGSDAAVFAYSEGVDYELGYLARPQLPVGIGGRGSLNVDPSAPRFAITSTASKYMGEPVVGDWLNKVGSTSGWTRGQVTQTCVTLHNLVCQYVTSIWSEGGDSGSPIFADESNSSVPAGSDVKLHGVLWGGPPGNWNVTWYSHLSEVAYDLGNMAVCVPGGYC